MSRQEALHTAATMMNTTIDELPARLKTMINQACAMVETTGGTLRSRQVIAGIILTYETTK